MYMFAIDSKGSSQQTQTCPYTGNKEIKILGMYSFWIISTFEIDLDLDLCHADYLQDLTINSFINVSSLVFKLHIFLKFTEFQDQDPDPHLSLNGNICWIPKNSHRNPSFSSWIIFPFETDSHSDFICALDHSKI